MPEGPHEATRWLQCIFASELSFILHLPLLIVPEWVGPPPIGPGDKRRPLKFEEYSTPRTDYNFAVLHTLIAVRCRGCAATSVACSHCLCRQVVRIVLHIVIAILVWLPLREVVLAAEPYGNRATSVYIGEVFSALADSALASVAGYILIVSTGLWFLAYIHFRAHFARLEKQSRVAIPEDLYWFCHIGVLNFVLDLPDFRVRLSRAPHCPVCV